MFLPFFARVARGRSFTVGVSSDPGSLREDCDELDMHGYVRASPGRATAASGDAVDALYRRRSGAPGMGVGHHRARFERHAFLAGGAGRCGGRCRYGQCVAAGVVRGGSDRFRWHGAVQVSSGTYRYHSVATSTAAELGGVVGIACRRGTMERVGAGLRLSGATGTPDPPHSRRDARMSAPIAYISRSVELVDGAVSVTCWAYDADADTIWGGAADGTVAAWHLRSGQCLCRLYHPLKTATALALFQRRLELFVGLNDGTVHLYIIGGRGAAEDQAPMRARHLTELETHQRTPVTDIRIAESHLLVAPRTAP
eukprot:ctg_769.g378